MNTASLDPTASHWERHALTWQHFASPLRPSGEDVRWMEGALSGSSQRTGLALLLGVTPELACMAWPAGNRLLAIDQSPGMLRHVWPAAGPSAHDAHAICGDWANLPLTDAALDAVAGDGILLFFPFAQALQRLMREIRRVLTSEGL